MKGLLYALLAALGLFGLALSLNHDVPYPMVAQAVSTPQPAPTAGAPMVPTAPAATPGVPMVPAAPPSVQGDLVIDFLGAIKGYVEPCG